MDFNKPIGIIELGNLNLKCLILKINPDESSEILSSSLTKSEGIHNGVVVNLQKATSAVRTCISTAEKKAKILLKRINVIIEQPEFLCTKFSKSRKINGAKIQKEDIEFLLKEAKKQVTLNDKTQSIIHIFNHNYIVDKKKFIQEPINIYANSLNHEMTFVTIPKNNLKNINQAFNDCDIDLERIISCTFALGVKLLSEAQLQAGAILIDLGFEKISVGLFKNLALVHSFTLPIGINHIVKDISKVCSLNLNEAEIIKNNIDFFSIENSNIFDENDYLKDIFFTNSSFRKVSKKLMTNVVKSRLEEILEKIEEQVNISGVNSICNNNILLSGGGSMLLNIEKYFSNFFKIEVKKLDISEKNKNQIHFDKNFFSCFGAFEILKNGWETEAIPEVNSKNGEKLGFFARIFGNV